MTLADALDHYRLHHPTLKPASAEQQAIAVRLFQRLTLKTTLDELDDDAIAEFARKLLDAGRAPRTVNGRVGHLLTLWRWAHRKGKCANPPSEWEPLAVPKRLPKAWMPDEMERLLAAAEAAPVRRTWTPRHWRALILTAYDTSLRIGALLDVPRENLAADGWLTVPAELQKGKAETAQPLSDDTQHAIAQLPWRERLFDWPYHRRAVWTFFRSDVLVPAGLPSGRRDLFHKLRRTSYTQVYARLSPQAATQHAAHTSDLSCVYLDPVLAAKIKGGVTPVAVLPRPGQAEPQPKLDRLAELVCRLNAADRLALAAIAERLVG